MEYELRHVSIDAQRQVEGSGKVINTLRTSIFANLYVFCMHTTATEISIKKIDICNLQ